MNMKAEILVYSNKTRKVLKIFWGLTNLIIGGLIYIIWRKDTLLMFSWFNKIGISSEINMIRNEYKDFYFFIPKWVIMSLPNALWFNCGLLFLSIIWQNNDEEKIIWFVILFIIALGIEIGQLFHIISGVYDKNDMFLILGVMLFTIIFELLRKVNEDKL